MCERLNKRSCSIKNVEHDLLAVFHGEGVRRTGEGVINFFKNNFPLSIFHFPLNKYPPTSVRLGTASPTAATSLTRAVIRKIRSIKTHKIFCQKT